MLLIWKSLSMWSGETMKRPSGRSEAVCKDVPTEQRSLQWEVDVHRSRILLHSEVTWRQPERLAVCWSVENERELRVKTFAVRWGPSSLGKLSGWCSQPQTPQSPGATWHRFASRWDDWEIFGTLTCLRFFCPSWAARGRPSVLDETGAKENPGEPGSVMHLILHLRRREEKRREERRGCSFLSAEA